MFVIGTAGHVDHGKSTLVHALSGIDPDRLQEEKDRGLTIDLGFAWLDLPSGRDVSIVDVPGHERFIKNMLAGAGGVDLALFVVAADEGPMPQTREHLAILDLLDVPAGVVAITKCDLVEPEYVELVEAELDDVFAGTCLEGAQKVRTAATTGEGIDELLTALDSALDATSPKRDLGRPRLPIDRAFTIQGFGAVVTGTLLDGALHIGQEVSLAPDGTKARIRGLQRHKTKVDTLEPGTRAAVNLSGVHVDQIRRGMVLTLPKTAQPVRAVDVSIRAAETMRSPLMHDAGVTFLSATSESQAKLRLLDREELVPGDSGWAQLVFETQVAVLPGDHFVIRTSNDTVAGGRIAVINPKRHRRHHQETLDALARALEGTLSDRILDELLRGPAERSGLAQRLTAEPSDLDLAAEELLDGGLAQEHARLLYAQAWLEAAEARVSVAVESYLAESPLRSAAPREHVRSSSGLDAGPFQVVVAARTAGGALEERGAGLAPPDHAATLSEKQQRRIDAYLAALRLGRFSPPTSDPLPEDLLSYANDQGLIEATRAGVVFDAGSFAEIRSLVDAHFQEVETLTLAQLRDLLDTSRKYAQAILEHLDDLRITRRVGDERVPGTRSSSGL